MKWPQKLIEAKLLKRYKRFFADVEFAGRTEVAHVANTGSLKSAIQAGQACLISPAQNPERKLKFSLEAVKTEAGHWVGVNTSWPNQLAKEAFNQKTLKHWQKFATLQSEVKINDESRLDLLLESEDGKKHYVEIKNVTLRNGDSAQFPDGVSERAQKHLKELMKLIKNGKKQGTTAEILFTVQRDDCKYFSPADDIDPEYGKLLRQAEKAGVLISVRLIEISLEEIKLTDKKLEVRL